MPNHSEIYRKYDELADKEILFAAYADPPGFTEVEWGKIVTMPDGWHSSAQDRIKGTQITELNSRKKYGEIIDSSWDSKGGLIIVGKTQVKHVIQRNIEDMEMRFTSLCAAIEYAPKYIAKTDTFYCEDTKVDRFIRVEDGGGCNSAGCIQFPLADDFSKMIVDFRRKHMFHFWGQKSSKQFHSRPLLSAASIKRKFPHINFDCNLVLDGFKSNVNEDGIILRRQLGESVALIETMRYQNLRITKLRG